MSTNCNSSMPSVVGDAYNDFQEVVEMVLKNLYPPKSKSKAASQKKKIKKHTKSRSKSRGKSKRPTMDIYKCSSSPHHSNNSKQREPEKKKVKDVASAASPETIDTLMKKTPLWTDISTAKQDRLEQLKKRLQQEWTRTLEEESDSNSEHSDSKDSNEMIEIQPFIANPLPKKVVPVLMQEENEKEHRVKALKCTKQSEEHLQKDIQDGPDTQAAKASVHGREDIMHFVKIIRQKRKQKQKQRGHDRTDNDASGKMDAFNFNQQVKDDKKFENSTKLKAIQCALRQEVQKQERWRVKVDEHINTLRSIQQTLIQQHQKEIKSLKSTQIIHEKERRKNQKVIANQSKQCQEQQLKIDALEQRMEALYVMMEQKELKRVEDKKKARILFKEQQRQFDVEFESRFGEMQKTQMRLLRWVRMVVETFNAQKANSVKEERPKEESQKQMKDLKIRNSKNDKLQKRNHKRKVVVEDEEATLQMLTSIEDEINEGIRKLMKASRVLAVDHPNEVQEIEEMGMELGQSRY